MSTTDRTGPQDEPGSCTENRHHDLVKEQPGRTTEASDTITDNETPSD